MKQFVFSFLSKSGNLGVLDFGLNCIESFLDSVLWVLDSVMFIESCNFSTSVLLDSVIFSIIFVESCVNLADSVIFVESFILDSVIFIKSWLLDSMFFVESTLDSKAKQKQQKSTKNKTRHIPTSIKMQNKVINISKN